jgi:N6-adenosine-specific RNA methylase IME4
MYFTNMADMPNKYNILYMDPPWPYTSFGTAKLLYNTMTWEQLKDFPINTLMAPQSVVFCWITSPLANEQYRVINHWCDKYSLTFQGEPFVWVKTKKDGNPLGATGPRPRMTKPLSERIVCFSNVKKGRPFALANDSTCQTVFYETEDVWTPREGHSVKPEIFREKIEQLFKDPTLSKLELFSRRDLPGWDHYGNEPTCD